MNTVDSSGKDNSRCVVDNLSSLKTYHVVTSLRDLEINVQRYCQEVLDFKQIVS